MGMNLSAAVGVYFWHSQVTGPVTGEAWGGCLLAGDGDPGYCFFNNVKL